MPEKYEILSQVYDEMIRLASGAHDRLSEAKTMEDINFHYAQHQAFMKAVETVHEQMREVLRQS